MSRSRRWGCTTCRRTTRETAARWPARRRDRADHRVGLSALPDRLPRLPVLRRTKKSASSATSTTTIASRFRRGAPTPASSRSQDILTALERVDASDSESRAYTLTGGSVTSTLQGKNEVEFYAQYVEAIETRFPGRWISKVVTQAWPIEDGQAAQGGGRADLSSQLRGLGSRALPEDLPGQGALHRARRVDSPHRGRRRGLRPVARHPQLRRGRRDGAAVRLHRGRGRHPLDRRGAGLLHGARASRRASPPGARSR